MKVEFLKSLGLDDEIISKIQAESGKDVEAEKEKTRNVQKDLDAANNKISGYETQIKDLKSVDTEGLKNRIKDLEKQIDDRKAADDAAIREKNYTERFEKVTGERKYLNDFTRSGVYEEFKTAITDKANDGKNDSDLFEALVKDREGIFASTNPGVDVPGMGNGGGTDKIDENQVRAVMGLPPLKA